MPSNSFDSVALRGALAAAFEGRDAVFLSDSPEVVAGLSRAGLLADLTSEEIVSGLPEAAVVLPMADETYPSPAFFEQFLGGARLLLLPMSAFHGDMAHVTYYLDLLARTDLAASVAENNRLLSVIMKAENALRLRGRGSDATLALSDNININRPKLEVEIKPGEWVTPAHYFEVHLTPDVHTGATPFDVHGQFSVEGCAVAHHKYLYESTRPMAIRAWSYLSELRDQGAFPLTVEVADSHIRAIWANGLDISPTILQLTGRERRLRFTEMSFGTNVALDLGSIDWAYNSQINESSSGIHFAAGDGYRTAHIDFICPDVQLDDVHN